MFTENQTRKVNAAIIDGRLLQHLWSPELPFIENLKAVIAEAAAGGSAMFATSEEELFKAAVACAMLNSQGEDFEWLREQMRGLQILSAIFVAAEAGGSFDLSEVQPPKVQRDYALADLWRKAKGR